MSPKESEIKFGVSTLTFLNQQISPVEGIGRYLLPGLKRKPKLDEVEGAITACEKIGDLGLEIVYRKWGREKIKRLLKEKQIPILNVHGPIWWDTLHAFRQGFEEEEKTGVLFDPLLSWVAFGFLKGEFEKSFGLAEDLESPHLTLHPGGADILHKKGLLEREIEQPVDVLIEPDWKRINPQARSWVWQPEKVIEIAQTAGLGIAFDTSHEMISQNKLDLYSAFEFYHQNSPGGIKVIHLSGAIPTKEGQVHGGRPLDPRLVPEKVIRHIQEFYRQIIADGWTGTVIIELSVGMGKTLDQKIKATEMTREALETMPKVSSLSLPRKSTIQSL